LTAYSVNIWKVGKCAAAITWVAGTTAIPLGKVTKVRALIKSAGGAVALARKLVAAGSYAKKGAALRDFGIVSSADILGIAAIQDNC
jgi:hypothetical protein